MSSARFSSLEVTGAAPITSTPGVLVLSFHLPPENVPCTLQAGFTLNALLEAGINAEGLSISLSPFCGVQPAGEHIHRTPENMGPLRRLQQIEALVSYYLKLDEYGNTWVPYATNAGAEMIVRHGITGIVSISPPPASHIAALNLKRRFPFLKWVAMFQDPYLDNPFRRSSMLWDPLVRRRERAIFNEADRIIANTTSTVDRWQQRYPQHADKMSVAWTGFDPAEVVRPLPLESKDRPVLAHVGAIYGGRRIAPLLRSALRLRTQSRLKPIEIRLVGDNTLTTDEEEMANQLQDGWVRQVAKVSRAESIEIAGAADYLLMLDMNAQNASLQVPSKVYDYIRIGRPILCYTQRDSMSQRILARSGVRYECVYSDMSQDEADEILYRFLQLPTEPLPPTDWFSSTFAYQRQMEPLVNFFLSEAASPKAAAK